MPSLACLKPKYWRVPSAISAHGRRPNRVFSVIVIVPRRKNSAHLHRPWRAIPKYAVGAECRRPQAIMLRLLDECAARSRSPRVPHRAGRDHKEEEAKIVM